MFLGNLGDGEFGKSVERVVEQHRDFVDCCEVDQLSSVKAMAESL